MTDLKAKILVVDDDSHIRELLRQELEGEGYRVRYAIADVPAFVLPACSCNNNNGACTTDTNCAKGTRCCNGTCSDPQTDRNNCGSCGQQLDPLTLNAHLYLLLSNPC